MYYKDIKDCNDIKIITEYVPYITKVAECKNIADVTSHKEVAGKRIFVADSTTRHLFYIMKLVQLYTDVEFEDNELVEAYDTLNEKLILDDLFGQVHNDGTSTIPMISWLELRDFKAVMDMVIDDLYENEHSVGAILGNLKDSIGAVLGTMLDSMVEAIDEAELKDSSKD